MSTSFSPSLYTRGLSQISICRCLYFIFRNAYVSVSQLHVLTVKKNTLFLRNALPASMIYSVCQKFYTLHHFVRVHKDTLTKISSFLLCGLDYKMS